MTFKVVRCTILTLKMCSNFGLFLAACSVFSTSIAQKRNFELIVLKHDLRCNETFISCKLWRNANLISEESTVHQVVPRIRFDYQFSMRLRNSRDFRTIVKSTSDFCEFVKNPLREPMMSLLWTMISADPKNRIMNECPVQPVRWESKASFLS